MMIPQAALEAASIAVGRAMNSNIETDNGLTHFRHIVVGTAAINAALPSIANRLIAAVRPLPPGQDPRDQAFKNGVNHAISAIVFWSNGDMDASPLGDAVNAELQRQEKLHDREPDYEAIAKAVIEVALPTIREEIAKAIVTSSYPAEQRPGVAHAARVVRGQRDELAQIISDTMDDLPAIGKQRGVFDVADSIIAAGWAGPDATDSETP